MPVKRQLKHEFGFTTPGRGDSFQSPPDGQRKAEMVTVDLNAALLEWVVQYRISDPLKFLFEVREPSATLRYVSESVMDLSRFRAAPSSHLRSLSFEGQGAFPIQG